MMPPLITVGSKPPASSSAATIEGRGGLAVHAGDRDAALQPHQLGQHLGAPHHRQAPGACRAELRVAALDCGRHDNDGSVPEILGGVADRDLGALVTQPLHVGRVGCVRALHRVAEIDQHLGDAAHADAADADEMDGADIGRQLHGCFPGKISARRRYHIRHAQHQIGEPLRGIERAGGFRARRHRGEPGRIARKRGDLGRETVGREVVLRRTARRRPFASTLAFAS
jgi:hypothetical protein